MNATLELREVSCRLGKAFKLRPVSCDIPAGTRLGIIGPSGCGKSTLLNLIGGHAPLSSGTIKLGGRDISHIEPGHRGTATVFQDFALLPHLTVEQNIRFGFRYNNSRKPRDPLVSDFLRRFGLESCRKRKPNCISGGEKQRTAIARALVNGPACLLLDEPTASLGRNQRDEVASLLGRLGEDFSDTTILLVTHDYEFAFSVCDRLAVLNKQDPATSPAEAEPSRPAGARFWRRLFARHLPQERAPGNPTHDDGTEVTGYLAACGLAEDLVVHPPTVEVAEILGGHTILYGTTDGDAHFSTDDGAIRFAVPRATASALRHCAAVIRTTEITLHANSECAHPLATGKVESVQFRGNHHRVGVTIGKNTVICDTPSNNGSSKWIRGQAVTVGALRAQPLILDVPTSPQTST